MTPLTETELQAAAANAREDAERARRALAQADLLRRLVAEVRQLRELDRAWQGVTGCTSPTAFQAEGKRP